MNDESWSITAIGQRGVGWITRFINYEGHELRGSSLPSDLFCQSSSKYLCSFYCLQFRGSFLSGSSLWLMLSVWGPGIGRGAPNSRHSRVRGERSEWGEAERVERARACQWRVSFLPTVFATSGAFTHMNAHFWGIHVCGFSYLYKNPFWNTIHFSHEHLR